MRHANEVRAEQNTAARLRAELEVRGFSAKVEEQVNYYSSVGLHQASICVPDPLVATVAAIALGYERLGYSVKIEKETGWFGSGLYRKPTTILTLGW